MVKLTHAVSVTRLTGSESIQPRAPVSLPTSVLPSNVPTMPPSEITNFGQAALTSAQGIATKALSTLAEAAAQYMLTSPFATAAITLVVDSSAGLTDLGYALQILDEIDVVQSPSVKWGYSVISNLTANGQFPQKADLPARECAQLVAAAPPQAIRQRLGAGRQHLMSSLASVRTTEDSASRAQGPSTEVESFGGLPGSQAVVHRFAESDAAASEPTTAGSGASSHLSLVEYLDADKRPWTDSLNSPISALAQLT